MELLMFCVAILLVVVFLFLIYARWRLLPKMWGWDWVLSKREKNGLETESLHKLMEGKASFASIIEGREDGRDRKLTQIVASHIILYLIISIIIYFVVPSTGTATLFWLWDARYISPMTRNVILLVMVVIVFPLVSIVYEYERRKMRRKKQSDISTREKEVDH